MTENSLLFILGSRLIGKPLDFDSSITGSYPVSPAKYAGVSQLAEGLTCNEDVAGSIPVASSSSLDKPSRGEDVVLLIV